MSISHKMAINTSAKFKFYLEDDNGKVKTITENHPKLNASTEDFGAAKDQLENVYSDYALTGITVTSETLVYPATQP